MNLSLSSTSSALQKRGYETLVCASGAEAAEAVAREMADARIVGFGGSMTISSLGLQERAKALGKEVLIHGDPSLSPERKMEVMRGELTCDLFLLSANAMTADGVIVNIDGNGNRVAAITWGPENVIHIIGMNKVAPTIEAALARARNVAAPINTARLGCDTPCRLDGVCHNCNSPQCICNYVHFTRNSFPAHRHTVILIGETWGY